MPTDIGFIRAFMGRDITIHLTEGNEMRIIASYCLKKVWPAG